MSHSPDQTALLSAFRQLLRPLAELAVSRGLPYLALDELLRQAMVDAAGAQQADLPAHGKVSRISTATGLSRREVGRLLDASMPPCAPPRWLAGEVFARWTSDPDYAPEGPPRSLPRQGPAPSFDALAQSVTRDVHPRSLLEELCRLGLAEVSPEGDQVRLLREAFVPRTDFTRMVGLLAENVGDHLAGATTNVLGRGDAHFEQAVFADELSDASVQALRPLISAQWRELQQGLVPALERLMAEDEAAGRPQDQRVRIGFYSYADAMAPPASGGAGDPPVPPVPSSLRHTAP
ncbi:MAG: DUF6502 family protein [Burkholderiaceae bacterium]|nr:DUF6502 family protein [Burkholderiaceae bacterium]